MARRAAERALRLLGSGHDITIAQVVAPWMATKAMPAQAVPVGGATGEPTDALERGADADISAAAIALGVGSATKVVTAGDPGQELCRLSGEDSYELLVVRWSGFGFLKRILLGSVSQHVLHHAPCPMLVVRRSQAEDTEALGHTFGGVRPLS